MLSYRGVTLKSFPDVPSFFLQVPILSKSTFYMYKKQRQYIVSSVGERCIDHQNSVLNNFKSLGLEVLVK